MIVPRFRPANASALVEILGSIRSRDGAQSLRAMIATGLTVFSLEDVGYATGDFPAEVADRLRAWLEVPHPVLGWRTPPDHVILLAGAAVGEAVREGATTREAISRGRTVVSGLCPASDVPLALDDDPG